MTSLDPDLAIALWTVAPGRVELRAERVEEPGANGVRIRTLASAISHGTEMLVYRGQVPAVIDFDFPELAGDFRYPIKYGYACVGRVITTGSEQTPVRTGDLVFAFHPHQTEFTISTDRVVPLPGDVDPIAATLLANLETAVNVMLDTPLQLGETIVVFGAGTVGLLIIALARRRGAGQIIAIEPIERRRHLARLFGAETALTPSRDTVRRVWELTGGRGADIVVEASGQPAALPLALECVGFQGTVVVSSWYGTKPVTLDLGSRFHRQRLRIVSSQVSTIDPARSARWNRERRLAVASSLLRDLSVTELISHRIPFGQASDAFAFIDRRPDEASQIVLVYGG